MKVQGTLVGPLLQYFFVDYLCTQKRVSPQTIASYRDTFRLLLEFLQRTTGIAPTAARIADLEVARILAFLDHLEHTRHNTIRSRNLRLVAIRSFFRIVALRDPMSVLHATRVLAIPVKRMERQVIHALSREEIDAILGAPDQQSWRGRRDHALLLTLYNSGARVSEIVTLEQAQCRFGVQAPAAARQRQKGTDDSIMDHHRTYPPSVVSRTCGTANAIGVSQCARYAAHTQRSRLPAPAGRDSGSDELSRVTREECHSTHGEPHHGDALTASGSGPRRHCPLARP